MPLMLSFDQIQRELKAILDFDLLFLAASKHYPEEIDGFKFRQLRRQELLGLAESSRWHRGTETKQRHDDQEWQESVWHGASVLQGAPHLRQLLPALDPARHDALREMQSGALEVPENHTCAGTTSET
jgi:hypothetical protein